MIEDPRVEKSLKVGDQEIPVWFYGNPKNLPIIFIHGRFRGFSEYVGDLPPRYLAKNFYICAFDLPGFGKSKTLKVTSVDLLKKIIGEYFKDKKIVLFGASYGGLVALNYAKDNPNNIKALIIAATPLIDRFLSLVYISKFIPKVKDRVSFMEEFKFFTKSNLSAVKVPTLLIYSTKDLLAPPFMGKRLSKMIPNSKLMIINSRIHRMFLHRIDETGILKAIEDFLKE